MAVKNRSEIDKKYKWNIEAMYPDESKWDKDIEFCIKKAEEFSNLSGKFTKSADELLNALLLRDEIFRTLEHALVYSYMKKDEDNREAKYQEMTGKADSAAAKVSAMMSFFAPELLTLEEKDIRAFIDEKPELKTYEFMLLDALREKEHILSAKEENIIAQLSEVTDAPHDVFRMLNDADMKFGMVTGEDGEKTELTHGSYISFMQSYKREVRKEAYEKMYKAYEALSNTISTNYSFNVKKNVVSARIRKYDSARQAKLFSNNIPESVYDNLVSTVNEYLPTLHKYIELRKKVLGVDELKMYDVYVPLVKVPEKEIPYEEAVEIMKDALSVLGKDYVDTVSKGVESGWIDVYENAGKTSGAYSFGMYDSFPYILLNYSGKLEDVFTIVHEMGHSMHSNYTRNSQPYVYGDYSIFCAEVASTVNESLLMNYLLDKETDPDMRKYLINHYIEEFRTTLFRQTMFAEFENLAHKEVENGGALTSEWLNSTYYDLNKKYFGSAMAEDEFIKYEWARIPHFYTAFYVYQYATGYSAANAISKKILNEGEPAVKGYKEFLKSGSSMYPVDELKLAGVDMSSPEPIRLAMETFKSLVEEFEKLMEE